MSIANVTIPEAIKPTLCFSGAANVVACDVISCKNALKVLFFIHESGANDTDLTLQLTEATDVAAGTNTPVTTACPIWTAHGMSTTVNTWTRQTDDDNVVFDPATQNPAIAIIEWDPAKHTAGYDCIYLADTGGNASNTIEIWALVYLKGQAKAANLPSVIVD
jgi:hypothetical protein